MFEIEEFWKSPVSLPGRQKYFLEGRFRVIRITLLGSQFTKSGTVKVTKFVFLTVLTDRWILSQFTLTVNWKVILRIGAAEKMIPYCLYFCGPVKIGL